VNLQKRLFAWAYHNLGANVASPDDALTREVRIPLLEQAVGNVLEVGAGDGANLPYYVEHIDLTLVEPNPHMAAYLREAAAEYSFVNNIVEASGESMPFDDAQFDTVITTHVLCSVKNQPQVLSEIRRVLKPGGKFLFFEHVTAVPGQNGYKLQRLIDPLWYVLVDGCHLTHDTGSVIRAAGFSNLDLVEHHAEHYPSIVAPHVYGTAHI